MNCDYMVAHDGANHCIGSSVISVLEPWKLFEAQFDIWQYCIIVNATTLRGLLKYVQVWTLSVLEWTPNAGKAIGFDLGKCGERRTSALQLSCRRLGQLR